jgi:CheY-like chemotaxis protein
MIRQVLMRMLRLAQYDVITAEDGLQGVQRATDDQPDLILMDMGLPALDGWQATRRIRAAHGPSHPPIIALTAFALKEDRQRCLDAGCDEYETKPIEFPRLLAKIASLLSR